VGETEVKALEVGLQGVNDGLQRLEKVIERNREETRQDILRIHERLDEQKQFVSLCQCEGYRKNCPRVGYPAWVTVLFSLCVGLAVFIITKGVS